MEARRSELIVNTSQEESWLAMLADLERTAENLLTQRALVLQDSWQIPDLGDLPPRLAPRARAALSLLGAATRRLELLRDEVERELQSDSRTDRRASSPSWPTSAQGTHVDRLA